MRPVSLWSMCACHGLEQGGKYRETLLQTLSGVAFKTPSYFRDRFSPGLRDRSAIAATVPGPVWLSATGYRLARV